MTKGQLGGRGRGARKTFGRVQVDTDVWTLALDRMRHVYDIFDHVAVAFSGGKDSTAALNVALTVARERHRLPLDVVFWDEEAIPLQTAEYVTRVAFLPEIALRWLCLPVQHRNACSRAHPYWWPWAPEDHDKWVRPLPPSRRAGPLVITELDGFPLNPPAARLTIPDAAGLLWDPAQGQTAMVMGIRAQESIIRLRAVSNRQADNYIVPDTGKSNRGHLTKVYPIYDWTTQDVWTAPARFGWDYNRAYDALEMAGLSPSMQRCSPAFGEEPLQKLWTYAHCFPEVWGPMQERVPGAAAAARYALTELYAYGKPPPKPAGMTWQEFIVATLQKWPADVRPKIAARIKGEIDLHTGITTDPILDWAPHPETGVCWTYLYTLAHRGDFKNRRQAGMNVNTTQMDREWERYRENLTQWTAAQRGM